MKPCLWTGTSENGAGAAGGAEIFFKLVFQDGAPGDDTAEDVSTLRVVRGRGDVAFLAAATVHAFDGLAHTLLGRLGPGQLHGVEPSDWQRLAGRRLRERHGVRTSLVSDERADLAIRVGVGVLEERDAYHLVGRNIFVQPSAHLFGESLPVAVTAVQELDSRVGTALLIGVPAGLATGVSDVFGRARDRDDVDGAAVDAEAGCLAELLFPAELVVEGVVLDVVERGGAGHDALLAVEQSQHVLAFFDVGLVGRDRQDLVAAQLVLADEGLQCAHVVHGVATRNDMHVHIGRWPSHSLCLGHFNFKCNLVVTTPISTLSTSTLN